MRPQSSPIADGFGPFFLAAFLACAILAHLAFGSYHPALVAVVAFLCALGGTLMRHRAARRREEARIQAILTTPSEFPAIPLPAYLLPYVARFDATDAARELART